MLTSKSCLYPWIGQNENGKTSNILLRTRNCVPRLFFEMSVEDQRHVNELFVAPSFVGKGSAAPCSRRKVGAFGFGKNHPRQACGIFPENLASGGRHFNARERGSDKAFPDKPMKKICMKLVIRSLGLMALGFCLWYMHSRGLSPVCVALIIICFRGFFRLLYAIASCIVTCVLIAVILSFMIY